MLNYSKEELWGLYKQIPKELQRATFSEEIGQNIRDICNNHDISDEDLIISVIKSVGYVFLGLLSPTKYSDILQKELNIKEEEANKISDDITSIVFLPLKTSLDPLYQIKIVAPKNNSFIKTSNNKIRKKDDYREPIE